MTILNEVGTKLADQLLTSPDKSVAAESVAKQINRLYYAGSSQTLSLVDKQILIEIITIEIVKQVGDINVVKESLDNSNYQQLIDKIKGIVE